MIAHRAKPLRFKKDQYSQTQKALPQNDEESHMLVTQSAQGKTSR